MDLNIKVFEFGQNGPVLTANLRLVKGENRYQITARNEAGSTSKSGIILYQPSEKPIVTIIDPKSNPYKTNKNEVTVFANIENIKNRNQIKVYVNQIRISRFTFDPNREEFYCDC